MPIHINTYLSLGLPPPYPPWYPCKLEGEAQMIAIDLACIC